MHEMKNGMRFWSAKNDHEVSLSEKEEEEDKLCVLGGSHSHARSHARSSFSGWLNNQNQNHHRHAVVQAMEEYISPRTGRWVAGWVGGG